MIIKINVDISSAALKRMLTAPRRNTPLRGSFSALAGCLIDDWANMPPIAPVLRRRIRGMDTELILLMPQQIFDNGVFSAVGPAWLIVQKESVYVASRRCESGESVDLISYRCESIDAPVLNEFIQAERGFLGAALASLTPGAIAARLNGLAAKIRAYMEYTGA